MWTFTTAIHPSPILDERNILLLLNLNLKSYRHIISFAERNVKWSYISRWTKSRILESGGLFISENIHLFRQVRIQTYDTTQHSIHYLHICQIIVEKKEINFKWKDKTRNNEQSTLEKQKYSNNENIWYISIMRIKHSGNIRLT